MVSKFSFYHQENLKVILVHLSLLNIRTKILKQSLSQIYCSLYRRSENGAAWCDYVCYVSKMAYVINNFVLLFWWKSIFTCSIANWNLIFTKKFLKSLLLSFYFVSWNGKKTSQQPNTYWKLAIKALQKVVEHV